MDDEPLTRREYFDWLARALSVPPPKLLPFWAKWMLGSLGDLMARSLRISNAKLKGVSPWRPKYPSVREGWPAVVAAMPKEATGLAA